MTEEDKKLETIKTQVLEALEHPEAEEGLYFRNFRTLHEVDERRAVVASDEELLEALRELIDDGKVAIDETGEEVVFSLALSN